MTHPDVFAPAGWSVPTWSGSRRRPSPSRWLAEWVEDPLERAMLVAIVLVSGVLLWVLSTGDDLSARTTWDSCVVTAVDDARAFAAVLGDSRPIGVSFAQDWCARR